MIHSIVIKTSVGSWTTFNMFCRRAMVYFGDS